LVNFRVENLKGTPYGTRSYLSGGAALGNQGGEEAGCPPGVPFAKARGTCCSLRFVYRSHKD